MNGVHDMGGMHGFGKVEPEADEPVFHEEWEGRVLALNRAMGYAGVWTIDTGRFSREKMPADLYLGSSYYQKWAIGLEQLLIDHGLVGADEFEAGHSLRPGKPLTHTLKAADYKKVLGRRSFARPTNTPAQFKLNDRVRMKNINPPTHTRSPRYVRGKVGSVVLVHGCHVYPDTVAIGQGENPQWLYTVRFHGRDLWGADCDPTVTVSVDAFEPYLEPA
jgi:nitrile hydratase subunit beta